jgi:hypothetical protein
VTSCDEKRERRNGGQGQQSVKRCDSSGHKSGSLCDAGDVSASERISRQ